MEGDVVLDMKTEGLRPFVRLAWLLGPRELGSAEADVVFVSVEWLRT